MGISNGAEKQIIVKDLLVSYQETGEKSPVLLFLHGWRSNKEAWGGVINKISNFQFPISTYALDLPGFGKSQMPKGVMGVGDYAETVAGFIRKLGLQRVIIVGHSFGGRVGIKLSATHPELISELVLVDSAGFAAEKPKKDLMGVIAKVARPFFKLVFMQGLRKRIYKQIGAEDYVATPELQQTFVKVVGEDLTRDIKKIVCPTLIVYGENDLDTPVSFGQRMQSLIKNSKFLLLKDAGHFSFIDQPEKFVDFLITFIETSKK